FWLLRLSRRRSARDLGAVGEPEGWATSAAGAPANLLASSSAGAAEGAVCWAAPGEEGARLAPLSALGAVRGRATLVGGGVVVGLASGTAPAATHLELLTIAGRLESGGVTRVGWLRGVCGRASKRCAGITGSCWGGGGG